MKNTATGPIYETAAAGSDNGRNLMTVPDHVRAVAPLSPEQAKERYYRLAQLADIQNRMEETERLLADLLK